MTIVNVPLERMLESIGDNPKIFSYIYHNSYEQIPPRMVFDSIKHNIQGLTAFAFENAKNHGEFPVRHFLYVGEKGILASMEDSGNGFDFKDVQKKFEEGKVYWNHRGCGFKQYNDPDYFVSFENNGRKVNILKLF